VRSDEPSTTNAGRPDEVDFVSGRTRIYGIVGDPIEQVRSPEMISAEFASRGLDALLIPIHVLPADFDACLAQLKRVQNVDGLVFTIPYKRAAVALADELGAHARAIGAINALARRSQGRWAGDIFDGMGCVEAFRRRGYAVAGQRLMLIGAGGAGAAIGVAIAHEHPRSMRLYDVDPKRALRARRRQGTRVRRRSSFRATNLGRARRERRLSRHVSGLVLLGAGLGARGPVTRT